MPTVILDTSNLAAEGLTACTLSQSALGGSTLSLELAGDFLPSKFADMQPIALLHGGKVLFNGRITSIAFANEGGVRRWAIEVQDYWYLFDNQPAAAQLAEIKQQQQAGSSSLRKALSNMTRSWADLSRHIQISTGGGWTCDASGNPLSSGRVHIDVSKANYSLTPTIARDRVYTTSELLRMMSECNPDCLFISGHNGTISVQSFARLSSLSLPLSSLTSAQLSPDSRDKPTGVCVTLALQNSETGLGPMYYRTYPQGVSLESTGLRVFSATVSVSGSIASNFITAALNHLYNQAVAWYTAVKPLQHVGSVSTKLSNFPTGADSPLGKRLAITGGPSEWGSMFAPVSAVDWDFFTGDVTLTLGKDVAEPMLHEIEPDELSGGGGEESMDSEASDHSRSASASASQSVSESMSATFSQSSSQSSDLSFSIDGSEDQSESKTASQTASHSESIDFSSCIQESKSDVCDCRSNWTKAQNKINEIISTVNRHSEYFTDTLHPQIEPVEFVNGDLPVPVFFTLPDLD